MPLLFTLPYHLSLTGLLLLRILLALGLVNLLLQSFAYSIGPEPAQLRRGRRLFGLALMLGVAEFALSQ